MAIKVNLLPTERRVSGGVAQFLRISRMLGVIALAGFLVFGLGLAAFFIVSSIELNGLNSSNNSLKTQLSSLGTTEAQLVVLKDRIAKIKIAEGIPSSTKNLVDFDSYLSALSGTTSISELDVNPVKITTSLVFTSGSDLTAFTKALSASTTFKNVSFASFNFNPTSGYLVSVEVTAK